MPDETIEDIYKKSGLAIFCNGTKTDGKEFYAYVLMSADSHEKYQAMVESGKSYNLEDFGLIVEEGETLEPSVKVKAKMKLLYNFDHNLEKRHEEFIKDKFPKLF